MAPPKAPIEFRIRSNTKVLVLAPPLLVTLHPDSTGGATALAVLVHAPTRSRVTHTQHSKHERTVRRIRSAGKNKNEQAKWGKSWFGQELHLLTCEMRKRSGLVESQSLRLES